MSRIAEAAFGDTPYPESPGFKKTGTSSDAARAIGTHSKKLREDVLAEFAKAAPAGLTADEVAGRLGKRVLAIRPRVSELGKLEKIVRTGERRANESGLKADVWRQA